MHLNDILSRFSDYKKIGNNSYQVRCVAHKDDKSSLTISEENNKILLHCHAGCDTKDILSRIGLTEKDLFNNEPKEKPKVVAEYIYTDENKEPLFKVLRYEPKNFIQAKYENGKWIFKMENAKYVLYNLPKVVESEVVFFVEGEKDADNLNKIGLVATTSVGGAAGYSKRAALYVEYLRNKRVYIIPDNDEAGYKYADNVKKSLENIASEVKILKLVNEIPSLKEKQDISDVILEYGKEKTIEILRKLATTEEVISEEVVEENEKESEEENEIDPNDILSIRIFEELYKKELNDVEEYLKLYNKIKVECRKNKITGFDKQYKIYKDSKQNALKKQNENERILVFPEKEKTVYRSIKYELTQDGFIYEVIPDIGKVLVCYHPIVPIEKYKNFEDGTEKIKLGFYKDNEWNYLTVEKSIISSSQSIVRLSDLGISVTSENAKFLVKYLAEIENLNKDIIKTNISTSKLGWIRDDVLMPYSDKYEFDNDKDVPDVEEKFGEKGKLEDWVEFFRERRKYNSISRVIMAAGVASILLKRIKQSGFTLHIWRTIRIWKNSSMYGRSVYIWKSRAKCR